MATFGRAQQSGREGDPDLLTPMGAVHQVRASRHVDANRPRQAEVIETSPAAEHQSRKSDQISAEVEIEPPVVPSRHRTRQHRANYDRICKQQARRNQPLTRPIMGVEVRPTTGAGEAPRPARYDSASQPFTIPITSGVPPPDGKNMRPASAPAVKPFLIAKKIQKPAYIA